jgi:hypothetical protein
MKREYYNKNNILISDIPEEYLNVYAHTKKTYSDRVHACVSTLSYGNQAKLFIDTKRALLFERIGLGDITSDFVTLKDTNIKKEKDEQIKYLREIF